MKPRDLTWLLAAVLLLAGCVVKAPPGDVDVPADAAAGLEGGPVDLHAKLGLEGKRVISAGVGSISVDEDAYTTAVVSQLAVQLRKNGIGVEPGATQRVEIQVVHITIHPKPQFTCVIDFNRKLGRDSVRGLQVRAKSWAAEKACSAAASEVAVQTLRDPTFRSYLKGG